MQAVQKTVNAIEQTDSTILEGILEGKYIKPVYQPIVSLVDGQTFGYEALSRISNKAFHMNIEHMFRTADRMNKSWELEALCRSKALENSIHIDAGKKLFLNVNSNIIYDNKFREGFTKNRLNEYGLDANNIIFEITERVAILDSNAFLGSINHYKSQNYGIAIDDVGAGYSGLNVIASVRPNLMKLDMNLVRGIDKDEIKQLLCKAMVDFGKNAGIQLIAEGIETEEELKTLINLKVDYGQGYFLGIPQESFEDISPEKIKIIKRHHAKNYSENARSSVYPIIGYLSKPGYTISSDEKVESIYETLRINPTITEFAVVESDKAVGFMTRADLNEVFGGRFGYSLHAKKFINQLMKSDFLRVNYNMPVDQVSRIAMQRPFEQLYNPILVEKENKYFGMVTVKDLLDACTNVEIDIAMHSNPLTGLPGNLLIEKEILSRIFGQSPYCITYYDIDNFKAFNDAYGFENGDKMLVLVAEILKECAVKNEFIGHIGGDDFIVICDYHEAEKYCQLVLNKFSAQITSLYRDEDVESGYIVSKNRHGVTENFPIASLSIAGISNQKNNYQNIGDFSQDIAQLKKKCKRQSGNCIEII
ncbi:GGDEF domain-containing protein [Aminipila butyrica]|uniref:GGDEF domain-containing protein n=1 Tax=Aminipila butyrica TaxID=433296 RepID=A0A858BPW8_9FIRM|nr:GGDEF domain-containing protein [Aminipila butyrica]QIB67901.1 GGDEF domain-containing protein [Aminipila butyrica]